MPGANYLAAYQNSRLNEVVIPGSHDAGVYTGNSSNVQTQVLDISGQANAGCRFFDLRIATHKLTVAGQTTYVHKAFHLDQKLVRNKSISNNARFQKHQKVDKLGGWGGSLAHMLQQARAFVANNPTEFLILKFSKCYNWPDIARTCVQHLAGQHYTGAGNLNNKTVQDLAGTVITIFDEAARPKLAPFVNSLAPLPHGILFFRALFDKETGISSGYDPNFWGLQYFGKFSSTSDIDKNTAKQGKTMTAGAATHMDAIGMMYWTTTGMFGNIQTRNTNMWNQTNVAALQATWGGGLEASITHRFGNEAENAMQLAQINGGALGGRLKSFMPNIVMMDFVDLAKCNIIDQLNAVAAVSLQQLMVPAPLGPQPHPDPVG